MDIAAWISIYFLHKYQNNLPCWLHSPTALVITMMPRSLSTHTPCFSTFAVHPSSTSQQPNFLFLLNTVYSSRICFTISPCDLFFPIPLHQAMPFSVKTPLGILHSLIQPNITPYKEKNKVTDSGPYFIQPNNLLLTVIPTIVSLPDMILQISHYPIH